MPPKRQPSLGRIVRYFMESHRRYFPAIITAIHNEAWVNLVVFSDVQGPFTVMSAYLHPDGEPFNLCPVVEGHISFWPPMEGEPELPEWPYRRPTLTGATPPSGAPMGEVAIVDETHLPEDPIEDPSVSGDGDGSPEPVDELEDMAKEGTGAFDAEDPDGPVDADRTLPADDPPSAKY